MLYGPSFKQVRRHAYRALDGQERGDCLEQVCHLVAVCPHEGVAAGGGGRGEVGVAQHQPVIVAHAGQRLQQLRRHDRGDPLQQSVSGTFRYYPRILFADNAQYIPWAHYTYPLLRRENIVISNTNAIICWVQFQCNSICRIQLTVLVFPLRFFYVH